LGRSYLALAALATTGGLSACGREQQTYCTDRGGLVVTDDHCDSRTPGYFYSTGSYGRGRGPGYQLHGGSRVASDDTAGRSKAGLPATGHVSNGHVTSGGFGSGHGSSGHGSSGG
jgi:hypothetical protein